MIVVRVELHSAVSRQVTELARMHISNTGQGTPTHGYYVGQTYVGRCTEALNRRTISRTGSVSGFPRKSTHVWNLVTRMLTAMGYS